MVEQKKYRVTFVQLWTPNENERLGEALTEAVPQGLEQVVETENIDPAQYCLLLAIHSKSFTNIWAQSSQHVPLNEQLHNQDYAHSYLEQLARKLNSAQVVDPERDGFFVDLWKGWDVEEKMGVTWKSQEKDMEANGEKEEMHHTDPKQRRPLCYCQIFSGFSYFLSNPF